MCTDATASKDFNTNRSGGDDSGLMSADGNMTKSVTINIGLHLRHQFRHQTGGVDDQLDTTAVSIVKRLVRRL